MIYELRTYELFTHNREHLHERFERHTVGLFEKHGFRLVGFWETAVGPMPELTYLLAWETLDERDRAWSAFGSDQDWQKIRNATNSKHGPLVGRQMSKLLKPTAYSSMQ